MEKNNSPYKQNGYEFISPETGRVYKNNFPIHPQAEINTRFIEKLKLLEPSLRSSGIWQTLIQAGPESVNEFEDHLKENGKLLADLVKITGRHPAQRDDAAKFVSEFFKAGAEPKRKKDLAGFIAKLC